MNQIFRRRAALAISLAVAMTGTAYAKKEVKPEGPMTPERMFAKGAEYQSATISPDAGYVAVLTPFEDRRALSIIKLDGNYDRSLIKFGPREQPFNPIWTDTTRIMVTKAKDYGFLGSLVSTGDIYSANADATDQVQLFGYIPDDGSHRSKLKDEGSVYFMKTLDGTKGEALFYFMPWTVAASKVITTVYRVDTYHGDRVRLETFPEYASVGSDNAGDLRFVTTWDLQEKQRVRYRPKAGSPWLEAPATLAGQNFGLWYFDADDNHAYAEISDKGEPASLYRIDLTAGTREKIASHPTLEIADAERAGRRGPPVVVTYNGGKPKVDYLDPTSEWSKLHAGLMKSFPGQLVTFLNTTRDENNLLFYVYSDRHPGAYYMLDRANSKVTLLFESMEWIDPAKMSPMTSIEFKNRSGDTLYGYYTAPLGKTGPHPLVVMPHGGPFDVSDSWGYDSDVQYLASLGYAVLQVNYRGSGSRGYNFRSATYRQWGTGIQDDITDGVKYLIDQKAVDPAKICIYGASFGGYSAMMNPIRNPGMYKCAIGYAGVYDLKTLYEDQSSSKQDRAFFAQTMGEGPNKVDQSPVLQVAKLDVPMLLIHGKEDYTAPFNQFRIAQDALKKAGKVFEVLTKENEGHGFYKEENRAEVYSRMRDFLLKYNPPN